MYYNEKVIEGLKDKNVTLLGFADLSDIDPKARRNYRYGISIAIACNPSIVSKIIDGPHREYYDEVNRVNDLLKETSLYLESLIKELGFNAFSQANIKQDSKFTTPLPHKTVATRAGLGWIGKSGILITKEYGNLIRLNSVLTDMPLECGNPINESYCGNCRECVNNCPARAIQGINWDVSVKRDELLNPYECKAANIERGKPLEITYGSCGICIRSCPYTKKYINKYLKLSANKR